MFFKIFFNSIVNVLYESYLAGGLSFYTFESMDGKKGMFKKVIYKQEICPSGYPIIKSNTKGEQKIHWVPDVQK